MIYELSIKGNAELHFEHLLLWVFLCDKNYQSGSEFFFSQASVQEAV